MRWAGQLSVCQMLVIGGSLVQGWVPFFEKENLHVKETIFEREVVTHQVCVSLGCVLQRWVLLGRAGGAWQLSPALVWPVCLFPTASALSAYTAFQLLLNVCVLLYRWLL